ncbi:MAG: DUF1311 domain-containing protein [Cyanobacteria bacterium K_DeepCast_35m_m2_155]|nr:DUF1311 domain-containing protein [Cyanobacteria bacterium K_DeepCast_35m_m2_155]
MKALVLAAALLAPWCCNRTEAAPIRCPGTNTVEMRACAEQSWQQSDAQLRKKLPQRLMRQWHEATKALCSAAYGSYKDGTIYPQLMVGCDDRLNRALLQEFRPLERRGSP